MRSSRYVRIDTLLDADLAYLGSNRDYTRLLTWFNHLYSYWLARGALHIRIQFAHGNAGGLHL